MKFLKGPQKAKEEKKQVQKTAEKDRGTSKKKTNLVKKKKEKEKENDTNYEKEQTKTKRKGKKERSLVFVCEIRFTRSVPHLRT